MVQLALDPKTAPAFAQRVDQSLTPDELRGALLAARESLMARDMARRSPDNKLMINPMLEMCWKSMTKPKASLALTIFEPDAKPRQFFYNLLDKLFVGNWVEQERLIALEMIETPGEVAARMCVHWFGKQVNPDPRGSSERVYRVPAAVMPAGLNQDASAARVFLDALKQAGVADGDARDIVNAYTKPGRRASLAHVDGSGAEMKTTAMVWLERGGRYWVITEQKASPNVTIEKVSDTRLVALISEFMK